jgi:hypothetical protein
VRVYGYVRVCVCVCVYAYVCICQRTCTSRVNTVPKMIDVPTVVAAWLMNTESWGRQVHQALGPGHECVFSRGVAVPA